MAEFHPSPTIESMLNPHVLIHSWKKATRYIRRHNWVADVLEIDVASIQLRKLLEQWSEELRSNDFQPDPLRLVAAPKRGEWSIQGDCWRPRNKLKSKGPVQAELRPLAHATLRDQVLSTAFLICLSNQIETLQGDPTRGRHKTFSAVSYGNRLLCDASRAALRFRWGNSELYRKWFTDYRAFIERPKNVIQKHFAGGSNWVEVRADLAQFFDRVRPEALRSSVTKLCRNEAEPEFLKKFARLFDWRWHKDDLQQATAYAEKQEPHVSGFDRIALPQGLVASGFFANAILIDFDRAVREECGRRIPGMTWRLVDYARYVDDLRLVLEVKDAPDDLLGEVCSWLQKILNQHAAGLLLKNEKTEIILGTNPSRLIPVSDTMKVVQENVSGPLAVTKGRETLELLEGLLSARPTEPLRSDDEADEGKTVLPIEDLLRDQLDVRADTLARFSAHRWRATFRELRPICEPGSDGNVPTQDFLDRRAEVFSRSLIRKWVVDPSNVRLLRIAFDLNPTTDGLQAVLELLSQHLRSRRSDLMLVCAYVAAEIFRAGATETGQAISDQLPSCSNIRGFREKLAEFAQQIGKNKRLPWYTQQQAILFLSFMSVAAKVPPDRQRKSIFSDYKALNVLSIGRVIDIPAERFAALLIVLCQTKGERKTSARLAVRYAERFASRGESLLEIILCEARPLALEILNCASRTQRKKWKHLFVAYGLIGKRQFPADVNVRCGLNRRFNLMDVAHAPESPLRHEYGALQLLLGLLEQRKQNPRGELTPWRIEVECKDWSKVTSAKGLEPNFVQVHIGPPFQIPDKRYALPPHWAPDTRWRVELGQIMRAVLTANDDFSLRGPKKEEAEIGQVYRGVTSNFEHRRHGLVAGRDAFGLDWLPVTAAIGDMVSALLRWPGAKEYAGSMDISSSTALSRTLQKHLQEMRSLHGPASDCPILPIPITLGPQHRDAQRVRVAVVQSALPEDRHLAADATLDEPAYRRRHRRHLRQVLDGLTAMLNVRKTHREDVGTELVVLPELAVHPSDLRPIIERFADQTRCIVFCGLVFHRVPFATDGIVNSGMWVVPDRTHQSRNIQRYEQGKWHLTNDELRLRVTPFRPCQWILEYRHWSTGIPLWRMTASICYDATDLKLVADLRDRTDAYIVAALNKDVGTFDSMAQALHYHMYQHVIVANCGQYGGSVVQAPFKESFDRTILHHHGKEQALVSFFELDLGTYRRRRPEPPRKKQVPRIIEMKTPPAGFKGRIY